MKWTNLKSKIEHKGFKKFGEFHHDETSKMKNNKIIFRSCITKEEPNDRVYLWLLIQNDGESYIIYVGKASNTIKARMNQHRQGFKGRENGGSLSGGKKRKFIDSKLKLKNNNKIEIWAKSISNLELDLDKAESNEITDWKDEKNYWLFLNQKMPTEFFE